MSRVNKRKRVYRWYVEPLGAHTNKVIAGLEGMSADENFMQIRVAGVKDLIPAWRVSASELGSLRQNREQLKLRFHVYVQEGRGSIRHSFF